MTWPQATDFIEAVQELHASVDDEELRAGEVVRTPLGLPMLWSGNFADVFKIHCPATGNHWALKCFTREVAGQRERYRRIAAHLEQVQPPFTVDFKYLEQGLRIGGNWSPVLKMRWVEGLTLAEFVEEHLDHRGNLKMLLDLWVKLAARLREAGVAHADLQHGNVLLVPMSGGSFALRLIDYDGMYVPSLAGTRSGEVGHPAYQHPQRLREGTYNAEVDRFSHLTIYTAIRCLMLGRSQLWQRSNNGDNLLFREADFKQPATSDLFGALWELRDADLRALAGRLILACGRPLDHTPLLDEIIVNGSVLPLTWKEESRVAEILAIGKATTAQTPEPAMSVTGTATIEGTVPAIPSLGSRFRALGKRLWGGLAAAARPLDGLLRRLVGEENDMLRRFLWAALPLLLFLAIWAGIWAWTPSTAPWKLRPIPPRTVEAGNELTVAATVDNAAASRGKLRYGLGGQTPPGAMIDPQTGTLTWTPTLDQAPGKYAVTVSAETPDGRRDGTTLMVTVTAPLPLKFKPIAPQTVEVGHELTELKLKPIAPQTVEAVKPLTIAVALENAEVWKGKVRYSLGSPTPLGMSIDAATGMFTWTPTEGQAADKHKVTVLATGPDGRRDETSFVVNVLRPLPPLRLQSMSPQTVEAGKQLNVTATVENYAAREGKLRYRLGPESPSGATINAETGELVWAPPSDQAAGRYDMTVSVQGPDRQTAQTTLVVTVTRPIPVPAKFAGKEIAVDLGRGVKLEMVLIPAGEFLMGSHNANGDEKPQHPVTITKPFYLGKYPVTREQWGAVMGKNLTVFNNLPRNAAEGSWYDCQHFLRKLNAEVGGGRFALPTEAQWEYACRAGTTTRYCFGDDSSGLGEYAWFYENSGGKTHPVGEKKPNAWGLYDMHGNVCEWCQDWYNRGYYKGSPTDDPAGPTTGSDRVFRGWSPNFSGMGRGSASRGSCSPGRASSTGLRVCRVAEAGDETRLPESAAALKIQPIPPQTIEAGKPLTVVVSVEGAHWWQGKLRFSLAPDAPPGASIDPQSGEFSWTPPPDQAAGKYDLTVLAQGPDGQAAQTTFVVTVTTPIPAPATLPSKEIVVGLGNGVKMELVPIPAGEFMMGSPDSDNNVRNDEKPQHRVRITRPFYLGKYLVTQEQWEAVMGDNPSSFKGPKNPVERVSWDNCQEFVEKLNGKVGGGKFTLPSEAQWEYACRAGSTTRYCYGDEGSGLGEYAWYSANSGGKTHPVGEKRPNAWGLYDIHGNVWEWCRDWYDGGYYANSPTDDPTGPATGSIRVHRGGSWHDPAGRCQSVTRIRPPPEFRFIHLLGFRVARVAAEAVAEIPLPEPAVPLKIQPIPSQTVEVGKRLAVVVSVVDAQRWPGKLRYGLAPDAPLGASIHPQSGEFSWTPAPEEDAGKFNVTVSVQGPDGQTAQTTLAVTVTRPIPTPATLPGKELSVDLGGGVKLEMVLIPAGEFLMGSPDSDRDAVTNEKPYHRVRITRPFYLGKYLVTQEQWEAVMGNNPSDFKGPRNPVESVSWDDCQQFFEKLNAKSGPGEGKFQLPTEAQWEYACRAGSRTRYCFGNAGKGLGEYAWYRANSGGMTHPVGQKKPNAWGLYDMHGNVEEWCQGWLWSYEANSPTDDPPGPTTGSGRVSRGGDWLDDARYCRSASRSPPEGPGFRFHNLGFRVARVAADK
jgi:formylglycine-generating enzyme required for sulfatase activity